MRTSGKTKRSKKKKFFGRGIKIASTTTWKQKRREKMRNQNKQSFKKKKENRVHQRKKEKRKKHGKSYVYTRTYANETKIQGDMIKSAFFFLSCCYKKWNLLLSLTLNFFLQWNCNVSTTQWKINAKEKKGRKTLTALVDVGGWEKNVRQSSAQKSERRVLLVLPSFFTSPLTFLFLLIFLLAFIERSK